MIKINPKLRLLREKAMALPLEPGVYLMKNAKKKIIYVGKAKALKNRVSQYFGSDRNHEEKVKSMVSNVDDFDYMVTDSEFEALVLENSLIKQYQPKYNILLKDDKGYSYIKITKPPWSKISQVTNVEKDGAKYLGPYLSIWVTKEIVDEAKKIFKLPACNKNFPQDFRKGRPCLNFYINQCMAPCTGKIKEKDYNELILEATEFIKGGSASCVQNLTKKMEESAENLEFERAAKIRDRISAIKKMSEKQKVIMSNTPRQDIIAVAQNKQKAVVTVLVFENSRLCDRKDFVFKDCENANELRTDFIRQYYDRTENLPPFIFVDESVEDVELLEQMISEKAGRKVSITVPQKGDKLKLVKMCMANAAEKLAQGQFRSGKELSALDELGRLLGFSTPPSYIEAYDISNTAGEENVGAMVVFEDARPLKSAYRKFTIKTIIGQDDYGSMKEVIERRFGEYERNKNCGKGFGRLPDLILLDGGKGHVSVISELMKKLGYDVPIFGMVKDDKHKTRAIAKNGGEIAINSSRKAFTLVSSIQDEVHRFAIGFHHKRREKSTFSSTLTQIDGIGEKRAKALLTHFKTIKAIAHAEKEELAIVKGMDKSSAEKVFNCFNRKK